MFVNKSKAHSFHVFVKRSELDGIKNSQSKAVAIIRNHYSASLWPFGHTLPYTKNQSGIGTVAQKLKPYACIKSGENII